MKTLLFIGNLGAGEIVIIALVILLLFGGKKIPELMKGIGKGVKSFKDGLHDIEKDITEKQSNKQQFPNKHIYICLFFQYTTHKKHVQHKND